MKIIRQSKGELTGIVLAWWCIILGGLGTILLPISTYLTLRPYILPF